VYGDEIGMGDDLELPERLSVHLPMQWTAGPHGGFTSPDAPPMPIAPMADGHFGYHTVNVETQMDDPNSLLAFVRHLNQCRSAFPIIYEGRSRFTTSRDDRVLRTEYLADHGSLLVFHNFSDRIEHRVLDELPENARLILHDASTAIEADRSLTLGPYGYCWVDPAAVAGSERRELTQDVAMSMEAVAHRATRA